MKCSYFRQTLCTQLLHSFNLVLPVWPGFPYTLLTEQLAGPGCTRKLPKTLHAWSRLLRIKPERTLWAKSALAIWSANAVQQKSKASFPAEPATAFQPQPAATIWPESFAVSRRSSSWRRWRGELDRHQHFARRWQAAARTEIPRAKTAIPGKGWRTSECWKGWGEDGRQAGRQPPASGVFV